MHNWLSRPTLALVATSPATWDPADIPALLRSARGAYSNTVAAMLAGRRFDDLPRNGPFVLGGMANHGGSAVPLIQSLGVSRQAASQLIDTLVLRGYLGRQVNCDDRRRLDIELTERGREPQRWYEPPSRRSTSS